MLTKEQYKTLLATVAKKSAKNELYAASEHKLLIQLATDIKPILDYLHGETTDVPTYKAQDPTANRKYISIKEKIKEYQDFSAMKSICRGDVITVQYQEKTRPGIVIRVTKDMVFCLLISSEDDSPYKLIENDSRFFPKGVITYTMVPMEINKALDSIIGVYGNPRHLGKAIRLYKQMMSKLLVRY